MTQLRDLFGLDGKVALVTGASSGIGLSIATAFSEVGARVIGVGRSKADQLARGVFHYRSCDVRDNLASKKLIQDVYAERKRLDILVNCAGITLPTSRSDDQGLFFRDTLATNLSAIFDLCLFAIPKMIEGGYGSIINVSSIAALMALPGNPGYAASKGGLSALTKALALDYGKFGIRANNLVPGYFPTSMTKQSYEDDKLRQDRADRTMLGRWGKLEELVSGAIFLASAGSTYITGTDLVVDGGWSARGL